MTPCSLRQLKARRQKALAPAATRCLSLRQIIALSWGASVEEVGEPEQLLRAGERSIEMMIDLVGRGS